MPSPIAHALAAYTIYRAEKNPSRTSHSWRALAFYCFVACAPDLDFLPGILLGEPGRFHQGISHSVGAAAVFTLLLAAGAGVMKRAIRWRTLLMCFCLYISHLALDYLSADTGAPYGIPVWWPMSSEHYQSPIAVFPDIHRGHSPKEFFAGVFLLHNWLAIILEIFLFLPVIGIIALVNQWKRERRDNLSIPVARRGAL